MDSIFDFLSNYGWGGVLAIAAVALIYLLMKYLGNKMDENKEGTIKGMQDIATSITTSMTQQNNDLINKITEQQDKLINYIIKEKNESKEVHGDMLHERMELTEDIKSKLKDIMNIHNAQRAFILEFHNSYQNLSGIPFAKFSCTYEWFDKGLQSLQSKCLGLPFSAMSLVVKEILESKNYVKIYTDMEKMEDNNPSLFDLLKDYRTKSIVYVGMFDNKNQLIGCLCLEYQKDMPKELLINDLLLETAEITQVINLRYKYQENV